MPKPPYCVFVSDANTGNRPVTSASSFPRYLPAMPVGRIGAFVSFYWELRVRHTLFPGLFIADARLNVHSWFS
jgi:hypothetical protein